MIENEEFFIEECSKYHDFLTNAMDEFQKKEDGINLEILAVSFFNVLSQSAAIDARNELNPVKYYNDWMKNILEQFELVVKLCEKELVKEMEEEVINKNVGEVLNA